MNSNIFFIYCDERWRGVVFGKEGRENGTGGDKTGGVRLLVPRFVKSGSSKTD